jgi:hypothetical protein
MFAPTVAIVDPDHAGAIAAASFELRLVAPAIIVAVIDPNLVAATATVIALGKARLMGPCTVAASVGLGLATVAAAIGLGLPIASATIRLLLAVSAAALGASLLSSAPTVSLLGVSGVFFLPTPSTALLGGRRGRDRQRRRASSKHPF